MDRKTIDDRLSLALELQLRARVEQLEALILDGCKVFEHYDLPEHALHYRRALERLNQQRTDASK